MIKTAILPSSYAVLNARFGAFSHGTETRPADGPIGIDETMTLIENADHTWSIRSPNGDEWLSVQPDGSLQGRMSSHDAGYWERFERVGDSLVELRKDGVTRDRLMFLIRDTAPAPSPPVPFTRLRSTAAGFVQTDGTSWQYRGHTAFPALALVKAGELGRVDEWFAYLASIPRLNALRVFFTKANWHQGLGHPDWDWELLPNQGTLDALPTLYELAAKYRLYIHGVGICDGPTIGLLTLTQQQAWTDQVTRIIAQFETVGPFEIGNEPTDGDNKVFSEDIHIDPALGLLVANGCGDEANGPLSHKNRQWATYHIPRTLTSFGEPGWIGRVLEGVNFIKAGYVDVGTRHEPAPGSVLHGEPYWIANGTNWHHQLALSPSVQDCYTFARAASAPSWCGSCVHPDAGQLGIIPDRNGPEHERITAWAEGWL